jgi:hypothetical protein
MAGLVSPTHVLFLVGAQDVDARDERGHDESGKSHSALERIVIGNRREPIHLRPAVPCPRGTLRKKFHRKFHVFSYCRAG